MVPGVSLLVLHDAMEESGRGRWKWLREVEVARQAFRGQQVGTDPVWV